MKRNLVRMVSVAWAVYLNTAHANTGVVNMTLNGTNPPENVTMSFVGEGYRVYGTQPGITCAMSAILIEPEYKGRSKVWKFANTRHTSGLGGFVIKGYPNDYCMGIQTPDRDAYNSHERTREWLDALAAIGRQNQPLPYNSSGTAPLMGLGNKGWLCGTRAYINEQPSSTRLLTGYGLSGENYGGVCTVNGPPPVPVDCKVSVPATIDHGVIMIGGSPSGIISSARVECTRAASVTIRVMDKDVTLVSNGHRIASTMNVGAIGGDSVTTTADPVSEVSLISVVQTPEMGVGGIYSGSSVVLVTWD